MITVELTDQEAVAVLDCIRAHLFNRSQPHRLPSGATMDPIPSGWLDLTLREAQQTILKVIHQRQGPQQ